MIGFANEPSPPKPQPSTGRDFISWSQLSTFRRCPLQYRFRYLDKVDPEFVASSLIVGSSIHSAIELYHRRMLEGDEVPELDELVIEFWSEWHTRTEDAPEVRFGKNQSINATHDLAMRMLTAFLDSDLATPSARVISNEIGDGEGAGVLTGDVIGIEEQLTGEVLNGDLPLLGIIDLVFTDGDRLVIRDYKTSARKWNQGNAESNADQILLYGELAKQLFPEKQLAFEFVVLTKTKSPVVERFTVESSPSRINRTKLVANVTLDAIATGVHYPNKSAQTCSTCPYRAACAAWRG